MNTIETPPAITPVEMNEREINPATALEIQTCLNSHQALVEACEDLATALAQEIGVPLNECIGGKFTSYRKALAMASEGGK